MIDFFLKMTSVVIAETDYGKVEGIKTDSLLNEPYIKFLGIPYAKAPLGELRFKVKSALITYLAYLVNNKINDDEIDIYLNRTHKSLLHGKKYV